MKKKKMLIIIAIILVLGILLFPIRMNLKDGGSISYKSLLYEVTKIHQLSPDVDGVKPYIDGFEIKILGMRVYKKTNETENTKEASQNKEFQLDEGRFVLEQIEKEGIGVPYLLLQEGNFTVVQNIAVSYQPSGKMVVNGNKVVMETKFAGEACKWTFELIADNKLQFFSDKSDIPDAWDNWKNELVFVLSEE